MNAFPSDAAATRSAPEWVESMGGPLIAVPVSALPTWGCCTEAGMVVGDGDVPDDYDRACAVDDLAGVVPVGRDGALALVLGDQPAMTCYLPAHRTFLRWLGADSEADLIGAAESVLADPAIMWEQCGTWDTDGPAVLMDSAEAGSLLGVEYPGGGLPEHAPVPPSPRPPAARTLGGQRRRCEGRRPHLARPGAARARRLLSPVRPVPPSAG